MEIPGVDSSAQPLSQSSGSLGRLSDNFDQFLTLLTTQLQHQDPLEPLDTHEFTSQLVEFSSVEQMIKTNDQLEALILLQYTSVASAAVSYIGKAVEAPGDQVALQDGKAEFSYTLEEPAENVVVTIRDATGNIVYVDDGVNTAGKHYFTWNGENAVGDTAPDGTYNISVSAVDVEGNASPIDTNTIGLAEAVTFVDGQPYVVVGDRKVLLGDIVAISQYQSASDEG